MLRPIVRSIPQRIVRSMPQIEDMNYLMYWELTTGEIININDEARHIDKSYSGNNMYDLCAFRFISSEQPHSESVDQWIRRNYLLHIP